MNRAIGHRVAFETRADIRMFLAQLARAVRAGKIEIHAFTVMGTHYHLLVRSLDGSISKTMQRIQNEYVRWFNQTRGRDGPLFRGRFRSRVVTTEQYRRVLVRYIDGNPVEARLARTADEYPHGSAACYVHRSGPRWLTRRWVEDAVQERLGTPFDPSGYQCVFARPIEAEERMQLQQAIARVDHPQGDSRHPSAITPEYMHKWLRECAANADGTTVGAAVCNPSAVKVAVVNACALESAEEPESSDRPRLLVHVALLSELSGRTQTQIAELMGLGRSTVSDLLREHRALLRSSERYGSWCGKIAHAVLRDTGLNEVVSLRGRERVRRAGDSVRG